MTDVTTLADRVEAGTVEMQRELLEAAYLALHPEPAHRRRGIDHDWEAWAREYNRNYDLLRAGAYVDAAMMLVPEGHDFHVAREQGFGVASAYRPSAEGLDAMPDLFAKTPALALAAAALRAHASEATNV